MQKRHLLFLITSDPRASGRPAEAVRIAAGLAAGGMTKVTMFLAPPAECLLAEDSSDLRDGDYFVQYLPLIVTNGGEILLVGKNVSSLRVQSVTWAELAETAARCHSVLQF